MLHPNLEVLGNCVGRNSYQKKVRGRFRPAVKSMVVVEAITHGSGKRIAETYENPAQARQRAWELKSTCARVKLVTPNGVVSVKGSEIY